MVDLKRLAVRSVAGKIRERYKLKDLLAEISDVSAYEHKHITHAVEKCVWQTWHETGHCSDE